MCETWIFIGSKRGNDAYEKICALQDSPDDKLAIDWHYSVLGILDSKASSLLGLNAIFIGLAGIFIGFWNARDSVIPIADNYGHAAVIDLILFAVSSLFCFSVIRINWRFLGKVARRDGGFEFAAETVRLANVIDDRTRLYWLAWSFSLAGLVWPALTWLFPSLLCYIWPC